MLEIGKGSGKHAVLLQMWDTAHGWAGSLTGGELPHVGGVVLAAPRPSLTGQGQSCDLWISTVPGHKDVDVAVPLARLFCARLGVPVSLTAGLHIDDATAEDIALLSRHCEEAGAAFLAQCGLAEEA